MQLWCALSLNYLHLVSTSLSWGIILTNSVSKGTLSLISLHMKVHTLEVQSLVRYSQLSSLMTHSLLTACLQGILLYLFLPPPSPFLPHSLSIPLSPSLPPIIPLTLLSLPHSHPLLLPLLSLPPSHLSFPPIIWLFILPSVPLSIPPFLPSFILDAIAYGGARFGSGSVPVGLTDVGCRGSESVLALCPSRRVREGECDHSQDAGVYCFRGA